MNSSSLINIKHTSIIL